TCLTFALCPRLNAQDVTISGSVHDSSGASIAGAEVTLRTAHSSLSAKSRSDGRFSFNSVTDSSGTVRVTASGFAPVEQTWSATTSAVELDLQLQPSTVTERIVVSATRTQMKLSDVPGGAVQLSTVDIAANPAQNTDDI